MVQDSVKEYTKEVMPYTHRQRKNWHHIKTTILHVSENETIRNCVLSKNVELGTTIT